MLNEIYYSGTLPRETVKYPNNVYNEAYYSAPVFCFFKLGFLRPERRPDVEEAVVFSPVTLIGDVSVFVTAAVALLAAAGRGGGVGAAAGAGAAAGGTGLASGTLAWSAKRL